MLIGNNITQEIAGEKILDDVSLKIDTGSITALIGPSGSGKTTLLRALSMVEPPLSGSIDMDGASYRFPMAQGAPVPPPWPKLSVVFQQLFLWPHLTLRENIMLPAQNATGGVQAKFDELVEAFSMQGFIDRFPAEASGGQKQRVALARAIILNPQYLLLDEVTSALDIEQTGRVLAYLQKMRDSGTGIFIITHFINFARQAADQILFMDHGRILARGKAEVLDHPPHPRLSEFMKLLSLAA